jgi:hypothetical protein
MSRNFINLNAMAIIRVINICTKKVSLRFIYEPHLVEKCSLK